MEQQQLRDGMSMKVEDLYLPFNHLFNVATKKAFQTKITQMVYRRRPVSVATNQLEEDRVRYFGCIAKGETSIYKAAKLVAEKINYYSSRGHITGSMVKLSAIKLATEPHQLEQYLVFSYVSVAPVGCTILDALKDPMEFTEGRLPLAEVT